MRIEGTGEPHAGEPFEFYVIDTVGLTFIQAYVNKAEVLSSECPKPPCHEVIWIPPNARGAVLQITARDSAGHSSELALRIRE